MIRTYSRFPYRRYYGYLLFALVLLIMSWENQHVDAAVANGDIPKDSIRLRILANSDSAADQAVKRHVRDAVVAEIDRWVEGPQTIDQARATIRSHMKDIDRVVADELQRRGFHYGFDAELAVVPFPTKLYGSKVYPAGNYEALRISLGSGKGQNWWCVLFPPLCFVDAVSGEATAPAAAAANVAKTNAPVKAGGDQAGTSKVSQHNGHNDSNKDDAANPHLQQADGQKAPQVKFFLWELILSVIDFIKSLFK
ncbi:stage II sporulation protein R [Paenibacillus humicola]|uniref:stage II sporulation protein R n=1 Tax=Paenibacillus humicola TaxID=3110540 RepID=UPI00237AC141|nr:stage II sporulation protein R [Paenibacillus humicola]